ncbi:MAG: UbiD family decarboxylase [Flavobacteriales bacterium]|jgi:4-hydroxy-3-polyprenylbenzoate decarboxylase|nr:UbiD family decarboxylase [Flavobacteriales bacterium]
MGYSSLEECVKDLEANGYLIRIKEEVNPNLEIASRHLEEFEKSGKALLFENIKGSKYPAVSNLFGSLERSNFIFRDSIRKVKKLINLQINPIEGFKNPLASLQSAFYAFNALPKKVSLPKEFEEILISDLPQIKCWPDDGGAFITLPQVFSEDIDNPGIMNSNLGMYRIQISGNNFIKNKEIGIHYQIHRGIGIHQKKAIDKGVPLKVSIFVGGPPSHTFSSVMPLPDNMSELTFAGILGAKRFRYSVIDGYTISADADFVICGEIANDLKPEGPFGDHLGYYSLQHDFPYLKVKKVLAKKDAIWPFTVVGRPPQEDSQFGKLIHSMTGSVIENEIPGLKSVNAVDDAGVHPLLLAIGSERYTPYNPTRVPQELLTIANHILGTGQLSLAKYLLIIDNENAPDINDKKAFFKHLLERVDWSRDLHFQTKTTIDTLDYSSKELNGGSKLIIAAAGQLKRNLTLNNPILDLPIGFKNNCVVMDGILSIDGGGDINILIKYLESKNLKGIAIITLVDDAKFVAESFSNWLWVCFTRSNPSHDVYGLNMKILNKHFSCSIPIIDARIKPHHAPILSR